MKTKLISIIIPFFLSCEMDEVMPDTYYECSFTNSPIDHPKQASYQSLMSNITTSGIPGIQLSVNEPEIGFWNGANGFADLASSIKMEPCQITRVGSTVKTFTAVTILLLQEEGKLNIEEPITNYLTADQIAGLENASNSTIEQLLRHASGIYNYIQNPAFQTASLNDLTKVWQPEELLDYARRKSAYFQQGTDVLYSNTNYVLLGWIIERVTGKPFYEVFANRIFKPLNMNSTQFAAMDPVPDRIIRGYVDFYSNFNLINATYYSGWDYYTADGGLISNAHDLNIFLHSLLNGKLITQESINQMLAWQEPQEQADEVFETAYGLGIFKIETDYGPAYLHSGDAIGYFASMVHFPIQNVTITWTVNGNYGSLDIYTQSKEAMEGIFSRVLK